MGHLRRRQKRNVTGILTDEETGVAAADGVRATVAWDAVV
jgi:hypothetical protein